MTDHTPEPYGPYVHGETRHDRIIACVNACAGIPTEQLGDVAALLKAAETFKANMYWAFEAGDLDPAAEDAAMINDAEAALAPFLRKD